MKFFVVFLTLVALILAEELDITLDHKKRGAAKAPSINALPSNGHQKPEQPNYGSYQQSGPATQTPLYPLAPPSYSSGTETQQPVTHQPSFSFLPAQPQIVPVSFIAQPVNSPKYQIIAMKTSNGQTQLTLIPHNIYMAPQTYASPSLLPYQHSLLSNQLASTQTPYQTSHNQNTYNPQQSASYSPHSTTSSLSSLYSHHQPQLGFGHNPILGQPSTMFIFTQPAPQLYNNYLPQQSNLLYSQTAQQLLNYYQSNPQAKNQLLYGNSGYQQSHVNSYQTPLSGAEYEKIVPGQVQQSLTSQKTENDINLNTNEFISQSDTQFRPIASYGARPPQNYKN